jgi:hypothetical protein
MRRIAFVLALVVGAGSGTVPPTAVALRPPAQATTSQTFSADAAFVHVRRLAGRIGPRPAGSKAYRRAVRYVRTEFTTLGYETALQRFPLPQGGRSWNVVATAPGDGSIRLLLGAHLDTVPGSPGGNDNASGVAAVLEAARVLAGAPSIDGLALVAFGAEEFQPQGGHHIGSES